MASRHPEIFSSAQGITMEDFAPEAVEIAQSFIAMDAPRHTQLRGITMEAFKPNNMRRLEGWIRGHARDLVGEMAHLGEGDFVQLVSVKLPGRIFGSFFGLPEGELRDKAVNAAQRLVGWTDPKVRGDQTELELFIGAVMDLHEVAAELIPRAAGQPRRRPADLDGAGRVRRQEDDRRRAAGVLRAAGRRVQRHHPARLGARHRRPLEVSRPARAAGRGRRRAGSTPPSRRCCAGRSPLLHMRRTATQDITVRGSEIKAGDKVVLWYYSGNRDEDVFDDPHHVRHPAKPKPAHRLRWRRPALLPRRGAGPHDAARRC